jgi:MFS family permease
MQSVTLSRSTIHLLGVTQVIGFGTSLYLLTVMAPAISTDTSWGLAWVAFGLTVGVLTGAIAAPSVGKRIGRGFGRNVLIQAAICFALGLIIIAFSPSRVLYLLGWCFVGLGMSGGLYDAVFSVIGRLEGQTAKASITKVALWGGFASTIFWPLSGYFEATFGWRIACAIFAAFHLVVCLPVFALLLPATAPVDPDASPEKANGANKAQSVATTRLVVLTAALFMVETLVAACMATHLVTVLAEIGIPRVQAIAFASLLGPAQVAARFAQAAFGAQLEPIITVTLAVTSITIGLGVLLLSPTIAGVAIAFYGAGIGVFSIMRGTLPLTMFGSLAYPALMGKIARPIALVQAAAPLAGASVLQHFGASILLICLIMLSTSSIGIALALRNASR